MEILRSSELIEIKSMSLAMRILDVMNNYNPMREKEVWDLWREFERQGGTGRRLNAMEEQLIYSLTKVMLSHREKNGGKTSKGSAGESGMSPDGGGGGGDDSPIKEANSIHIDINVGIPHTEQQNSHADHPPLAAASILVPQGIEKSNSNDHVVGVAGINSDTVDYEAGRVIHVDEGGERTPPQPKLLEQEEELKKLTYMVVPLFFTVLFGYYTIVQGTPSASPARRLLKASVGLFFGTAACSLAMAFLSSSCSPRVLNGMRNVVLLLLVTSLLLGFLSFSFEL